MSPAPSHEQPLYVMLPRGMDAGTAFEHLLDAHAVRHYAFPPIWALDRSGIDVPAAMPEVATLVRENIAAFLRDLTRLCDAQALDRMVARSWLSVDESVRDHYLERSTLQTFATVFRMRPRSEAIAPPPLFRADRIHDNGFELQYRLAPEGPRSDPLAPEEEASLIYYPFDPADHSGRAEAGIAQGEEVMLEAFAYAGAREHHRDVLTSLGWHVIDPDESEV